ncbi:EscR/YscR/HrcR family type III secretion system export apparatus protein (plasmid) [Escherichia coli]|uniref:EscR/YscR/HrcR family type III secretion system export apparatus protein n=1 Tax=Escherichia coli TaxID=562 RepID=UPI0018622975|nr:EscR/YscR/HrcR family type III secretion system export apparatus protein [Escherichia coli]EHX4454128.1 EscR/YscR/HrcR family type III secretion system export apparatus protein [Escherichia coli]EJV7388945.1 EscR/YscR/HrcR family type III secretion system export apparatus protein [Escherichia coli]QMQ25106.1 EscR/YscR/HrcR family type III secretion system export apparatus protein [Escherichia coli]HCP8973497.1 EscR/YscR/HrcR family type III secretion system export apparatus protein [Escheric
MLSDVPLIATLSFFTLLPFLIAAGTCYIKFSIVFVMVRNALGLQQVPSNMTLNGIALIMALFVMKPVIEAGYSNYINNSRKFDSISDVITFSESGLTEYKQYLKKHTDLDLARFFQKYEEHNESSKDNDEREYSIFSLLPAYALSEIKDAFKIGFYLYLPFIVVDLVISSILLALGMMMMSPITISVPVKLVLFVALDGWGLLSKALIEQYMTVIS